MVEGSKISGELYIFTLSLCILGNFHTLLSSSDFSKLTFPKNSFRNTVRVSNGLDLDQDRHFFSPYLGPNYLQRLTADSKKSPITRKELKFRKFER